MQVKQQESIDRLQQSPEKLPLLVYILKSKRERQVFQSDGQPGHFRQALHSIDAHTQCPFREGNRQWRRLVKVAGCHETEMLGQMLVLVASKLQFHPSEPVLLAGAPLTGEY